MKRTARDMGKIKVKILTSFIYSILVHFPFYSLFAYLFISQPEIYWLMFSKIKRRIKKKIQNCVQKQKLSSFTVVGWHKLHLLC
jgi:low temperature requirement protein LtrA